MESKEIRNKILELSIQQWNRSFGGTSALDISNKISISNETIMKEMEALCDEGKGTINANVELFTLEIRLGKVETPQEGTITHVFFPSKELLEEHFFNSNLARQRFPEYKSRLHCGANQIELLTFSEEVLTRYFHHPEFYEIDDSLSGGHIWAKSEAPENRYLYVRHGKRKLKHGQTAVTAIYKDLYMMSPEEQRHWHAYELQETSFDVNDPNFERFLARTYEGAFVDYPDPIQEVLDKIAAINDALGEDSLFKKLHNYHFRTPVENTRKSYYDCCSEFYKLIGPDNLDKNLIKKLLKGSFFTEDGELIHTESKRPLSTIQLLELLERKMGIDDLLSGQIRLIGKYRTEADHKITDPSAEEKNFVEEFITICKNFVNAANGFEYKIRQLELT